MDASAAGKILEELRRGYNAIAGEFSSSRQKLYWGELKRFVDYAREREAVLDVGCGDGRTYELFRPKQVEYAGIDISGNLVAAARERYKGWRASFEVGDILDLPVPDGRYDVALAVAVLHHVPSEPYRIQAMKELARAVRPGGYVLLANWNLWQPRYWKMIWHQRFGRRNGWDFGDFKIAWKKSAFARYYHAFTMKELSRLASAAGLEVVEQYYVKDGEVTSWLRGENLVTIIRRPADKTKGK